MLRRRELLPRFQLSEGGLSLGAVQPGKDLALFDLGAFAIAEFHDALANERRHLRPDARLDDACRIDDIRRIAARH
jgi:hypothetical protein